MSLIRAVDYSIIICTYNPEERILRRCLNAIKLLRVQGLQIEIILVDNNSTEPLVGLNYIGQFVSELTNVKLIEIKEPGLINARIGGVEASQGKWIVFFDDDNEPVEGYLEALSTLCRQYPLVVAWGPGTVEVDFVDGVSAELLTYPGLKQSFQERHERAIVYSNQKLWQNCYPFGTGLCIERRSVLEYIVLVKEGQFSLSGRSGGQLSSGEDTQMVLYCVSKGAAAGVAPLLKVKHIIPSNRTTMSYMKRLIYGTSVCYSTCLTQVYPGYANKLRPVKKRKFINRAMKKYLLLFFNSTPKKVLNLVEYIGVTAGDYIALNMPVPLTIKWILKKLKAI